MELFMDDQFEIDWNEILLAGNLFSIKIERQ